MTVYELADRAAFDTWWRTYWKPMEGQPGILQHAFRDLAQAAWDASKALKRAKE